MKKIAIIGYSFVLPKGIDDDKKLWSVLEQGGDLVTEIPISRFDKRKFFHPSRKKNGKAYNFSAGIIPNIDQFDPSIFNISSREANQLDPQQRLLLNHTYFALQETGSSPESWAGSNCGVFVGASNPDYSYLSVEDGKKINSYTMTGAAKSIIANRVSYVFDFKGPSMVIDTACSSALVALDTAIRSIQSGQIETAIVGGVNALLHVTPFIGFSKAHMISPTGRCRSFSADADGYVRSEGCIVFVIKDYQKAVKDGDTIHGIINKTGVNSDGKTSGLPLPSFESQRNLLNEIYSDVDLDNLVYLEAHGTGTPVGDPLEIQAIAEAIALKRKSPLIAGSIKSNIGHLEPASGLAGVLKALMIFKHKKIPINVNFSEPNPKLNLDTNQIIIPTQTISTNITPKSLIGVNSFGFGGTNAHVLLQAPSSELSTKRQYLNNKYFHNKLVIKSHSIVTLEKQKQFQKNIIESEHDYDKYALVSKICCGYKGYYAIYNSYADMQNNKSSDYEIDFESQKVAFVFSGNGCQYPGMLKLLESSVELSSYFKNFIEELLPISHRSLEDWLLVDNRDSYTDTTIAQPALFIFQVSVARYFLDNGLKINCVLGHSIGELAAAYISDNISLVEAYKLVVARSQAQATTQGKGSMFAINISAEKFKEIAKKLPFQSLDIAAINSPESLTIAGRYEVLQVLADFCEKEQIFCRHLDVDYPFHSSFMNENVRTLFLENIPEFNDAITSSKIEFISTVSGESIESNLLRNSNYWWDNIAKPVNFNVGVEKLFLKGVDTLIEISPRSVLKHYIKQISQKRKCSYLSVVENNKLVLKKVIERLYLAGAPWKNEIVESENVPLIKSELNLQRYWFEINKTIASEVDHILLGWRVSDKTNTWVNHIDYQTAIDFQGHQVHGVAVLPASAWLELVYQLVKHVNKLEDSEVVILKDVQIYAPLLLQEDDMRTLISSCVDNGIVTIKSLSQYGENETIHIKSRYLLQNIKPTTDLGINISLDLNTEFLSVDNHYSDAKAIGLSYTERFRIIEQLEVADDIAITCFNLDKQTKDYALSPFAVDGGFQTIISILSKKLNNPQALFLPMGFDFNYILKPYQLIKKAVIKLKYISENLIVADCYYYDVSNSLVNIIKGARFESVANQSVALLPSDCYIENLRPLNTGKVSYCNQPKLPQQSQDELAAQQEKIIVSFLRLLIVNRAYQLYLENPNFQYSSEVVAILKLYLKENNSWGNTDFVNEMHEILQLAFVEYPNLVKLLLQFYTKSLKLDLESLCFEEEPSNDIDTFWLSYLGLSIQKRVDQVVESLSQSYKKEKIPLKILVIGDALQAEALKFLNKYSLDITLKDSWADLYNEQNSYYDCVFIESAPTFVKKDFTDLFMSKLKPGGIAKLYLWLDSIEGQLLLNILKPGVKCIKQNVIDDIVSQVNEYGGKVVKNIFGQEFLLQKSWQQENVGQSDLKALECQLYCYGRKPANFVVNDGINLPVVFTIDKNVSEQDIWEILQKIYNNSAKTIFVILESKWENGILISSVHQSLLATLRVVANEKPLMSITRIVTDNLDYQQDWSIILNKSNQGQEIFLQENVLYNHEIIPLNNASLDKQYKLHIAHRGSFNHLQWLEKEHVVCEKQNVRVKVHYVGLNFRDVMYALGLIPQESLEFGYLGAYLGMEFSGEVIEVGDEVSQFKVSDRVFGCARQSFSTELVVDSNYISHLPKHCSMQQGATISVAFMTAYYAINKVAKAEPGQKILIHGAAGAIGLAAIEIAHLLDLEIHATVGSQQKRILIESLGVENIYDSRSTDFFVQMNQKDIQMDIVLNSLSSDLLEASLAVLAPFGHFIELGKRDIFENNTLAMKVFRNNITFSGIDLDQLIKYKPQVIQQMLAELTQYFDEQTFVALPYQEFPMYKIQSAFRCMQQGQQLGKVIINMQSREFIKLEQWASECAIVKGAYLVTGGTQGFGLYAAKELVRHGAEHLILVSYSGKITPENKKQLDELGVSFEVHAVDVSKELSVKEFMQRLHQNGIDLQGIIHAAVVYDDQALDNLTKDSFDKVFNVKALGGYWLDKFSRVWDLKHFIVFSSIAATVGNLHQANYVAANAYLEGLVAQRKSQKLAGQYIAWGPIADVGLLTRNESLKQIMSGGLGLLPLSLVDCQNVLNQILSIPNQSFMAAKLEGNNKLLKVLPTLKTSRYHQFIRESNAESVVASLDLNTLREMSKENAQTLIQDNVISQVAHILGISKTKIGLSADLRDLGMDSLMTFELSVSLENKFTGISISVMAMTQLKTTQDIVDMIKRNIFGDKKQNTEETINIIKQRHGEE
ncbi:acyl carrier protein [Allofrancisella inopinata]|uniref:SDR family NAD(P)-dependent oxidoreductase n=1 Tax=Allofrancisella inopinata TaxID=1085647 RepID=A0AAE7CRL9_9GAMM|nr:type I polyketide synthase [Allofrancisella inopinata]QIV96524.1 SDR family NAD(P)-dependent oxidoreductase [Allofrancisella inopinata]TDT71362.1 acyl carrier protein [Allofrancisella inopinata]